MKIVWGILNNRYLLLKNPLIETNNIKRRPVKRIRKPDI